MTGEPSAFLDRLPAADVGRGTRILWGSGLVLLLAGFVGWGTGTFNGGILALWCFAAATVAVCLVLPVSAAFVAPLFMGIAGWLVDMLPFIVLVGWTTVVLRWAWTVLRDRRLPRGGRWIWVPLALVGWTALGITVIFASDFKHFLLLLGIQFLASGILLAVVDTLRELDARIAVLEGLAVFIIVLSFGVFLEWVGVPIEELQNEQIRGPVEDAYALDAFPNSIGMIKYARSTRAGAAELRQELERLADRNERIPDFEVFLPKFETYEKQLIVRFSGSARSVESTLAEHDIVLLYDNVGVAPSNTVPRLRSFPRNALTYAGVCAALFPPAFWLAWSDARRRRWIGRVAVAACLFGAGFSLARGSWVAIALGILYLLVDGVLPARRKLALVLAVVVGAGVLTAVYLIKYKVDPVTARAGGGGSIATRQGLYRDTLDSLRGVHLVLGYGTERSRSATGTSHEGSRYIPKAGTHSTYLNYLFRTGVPGAILIVALYLVAGLNARASARVRREPEAMLATLLAGAVVVAGAHAVILSLYVEPIYTLSICLLLGLATVTGVELGRSVLPWRTKTRTA
ncbi:MAG TPA: O-antigen ligase family protein [Actinomycetota bacterium]|nr:O-antigen ligase family protein [Actinomycetota bacterium]